MKTQSQTEQSSALEAQQVESVDLQSGHFDLQIKFYSLDNTHLHSISKVYQSWKHLFENDPNSKLVQNPDHPMFSIPSHPNQPGYLMLCTQNSTAIAAGIFLPKSINNIVLKKIHLSNFTQGFYLCGNRFLVEQNHEENKQFQYDLLKTALAFCKNQKAAFLLLDDLLLNQSLNRAIPDKHNGFLSYSQSGYQNRNLIHFTETPSDYWNQFRSKSRTKHRRRLRQNIDMELKRITKPDEVADFLEAAHQISLNTWQTQRFGLRIKNDQSELEELTYLAINDSLRSYLLVKENQPVAFKVGYQHNGVFRDLEFGFDRKYAKTSPGEALLLMIFEDLIQHNTPTIYDFGEGDAEYKQRYNSEVTQSRSLFILPGTLKNRCFLTYLYLYRLANRTLRKTLKVTGTHTAVRQLFRYGKTGSK